MHTPVSLTSTLTPFSHPLSYAYPGVWDGQFTGCSWKMGECPSPLEGDDCWLYSCKGSDVHCPPSCEGEGGGGGEGYS